MSNKAKDFIKNLKISPFKVIGLIVLALYAISLLSLLVWGFFTSIKTQAEFRLNYVGLPKGMPWQWEWRNIAYVFDNFTYATLYGENTQYFQDYVLCGNVRTKRADKFYLYNLGHIEMQCAATHSNCYVKSARTDCKHSDTACSGGMRVRADKGHTGYTKTL